MGGCHKSSRMNSLAHLSPSLARDGREEPERKTGYGQQVSQ
jgi:hypothetical protein